MARKKILSETDFSEEYIKKHRIFPKGKTILLGVLIALQLLLVLLCVFYDPQPQDIINEYNITVNPLSDGTLDVRYEFVWTPIDESEPLTWVEIGMANDEYAVIEGSLSSNIKSVQKYVEDDYISLRVYFHTPYIAGDTLRFAFTVNQKRLLCKNDKGYFYEWVPGWFNYTPVESYRVNWVRTEGLTGGNFDTYDEKHLIWTGEMPCGNYLSTYVEYAPDAFTDAQTVAYESFYEGGIYDGLAEDRFGMIAFCVIGILGILAVEVWIVDCYVSYHRGRGFLSGYGHRVHIYGRSNPHYITARDKYNATHGGKGGRGGGCACACACACAGGGRAGCSQKDTYRTKKE